MTRKNKEVTTLLQEIFTKNFFNLVLRKERVASASSPVARDRSIFPSHPPRSRSALASSPPVRAPRSHVIPPLASKSALAWPWKSLWRRQGSLTKILYTFFKFSKMYQKINQKKFPKKKTFQNREIKLSQKLPVIR